MESFEIYMRQFEEAIVSGVRAGMFGGVKPIPAYPGKLAQRKIGRVLGDSIDSGEVVVIDYYGYMKKSRGFHQLMDEVRLLSPGKQVKMIDAPIVHFNSVRLETIAKIDASLVPDFGDFKKQVLDVRGFNHNYKV